MTEENLEITPEMNLEEFSRGIRDMLKEMKRSASLMDASLKSSLTNAGKIVNNFQRLAALDTSRTFRVDSTGVAKEIALSAEHQKVLNAALEESVAIWDRRSKIVDATAGTVRITVAELNKASEAAKRGLKPMHQMEQSAKRLQGDVSQVRRELIRLKPVRLTDGQAPDATGFVKPALLVAGTAAAGRFGGTLQQIGSTAKTVGSVFQSVGKGLDQFRMAATAPTVNPSLNVFANGIRSVGQVVAATLERVRGTVAALATDPVSVLRSLQDALNGVINVGSDAIATLAKLQTEGTRLRAVGAAFGFSEQQVNSFLQTMQGSLIAATGSGGVALAKMSGAAHALGDEFRNLSGHSEQTAFAQRHLNSVANVAVRLGVAHEKTTTRLAAAWRFLKTPYTVASEALTLNTRAVREFREEANKLPPGLRIATKALFELRFATRPIRVALKTVLSPLKLLQPTATAAFSAIKSTATAAATAPKRVAVSIGRMSAALFRGVSAVQSFRANNAILRGEMGRLESAAQKAGTTIRNVFFFPKTMFTGALQKMQSMSFAFKAASAAAFAYGAKAAIAAEQTHVRFRTMLRSGEQATALMAMLEDRAALTPFSKDAFVGATQQLLTAQIPVNQLQDKLQVLGDIAAGTGQPIEEFATIFAKAANTGKVSLEIVNQFAERGVPLYQSLAKQLGVSRTEMLKMISGGKVGFADLEAALTSTASGTGLFAGGMKALSETTGGLLSTLKDNITGLLKDFSGSILEAFNFRGAVAGSIALVQRIRSGFGIVKGVIFSAADTMKSAFGVVWEGIKSVVMSAGSLTKVTAQGIAEALVRGFATAKVGLENFSQVVGIAYLKIHVGSIAAAENLKHAFGQTLQWLKQNWINVFIDLLNFTLTVIGNMSAKAGTQLVKLANAMANPVSAAADLVSGNLSLKIDPKELLSGLTKGFVSTLDELPNLARTKLTDTEKALHETIAGMQLSLGEKVGNEVDASLKRFREMLKTKDLAQLGSTKADQTGRIDNFETPEDESASKPSGSRSHSQALLRGSQEALNAVFSAQNSDKIGQQQLSVTKSMDKTLKAMAAKGPVWNVKVAGAVS